MNPESEIEMELIDRYLHALGPKLPRRGRADILAELRSSWIDAAEDRFGPEPTEAEIVDFLREFGPPNEVAASYHPEGQYLIGPALYPLFKLVAGITLAAVAGAQVLAWAVAVFIANEPFEPLSALAGLASSLPAALGMVVIVFGLLEWFEIQPEAELDEWDPRELPRIELTASVSRGEKILEIGFSIVILVILLVFPQWAGSGAQSIGQFFANPVILRYIPWISLSLVAGIALDIYLLRQGHWDSVTRLATLATNFLTIAILALLVQGHTVWLTENGSAGFLGSIENLVDSTALSQQIMGMEAFRLAFVVALVVTIIETLVMVFRLVRSSISTMKSPDFQST